MAKQMIIVSDEKTYTLEFTRNSVRAMERGGFVASEVDSKPMTMIPIFFAGAFAANHPAMKHTKIDEIYATLKNKDKLLEALIDMYSETVSTLMGEPEDEGKNSEWTMVD